MKKRFMEPIRAFMKRQNEWLDVEPIDVRLFTLPGALEGFRIAVIADLHMDRPRAYHDQILSALLRERPELILIAGDTTDADTADTGALLPFFRRVARIAPAVAVLGNNDADQLRTPLLREMYAQSGVTLLENETRFLRARGLPVRITGLTDPEAIRMGVHQERQMEAPERVTLGSALSPERKEGPKGEELLPSILLMHQPQLAEEYAALSPSLIVAGHAHGGQIRLPLVGGLFAPGQGVLPKYTSGLYPMKGSAMVVSRGLGNHGFPIRVNNRPHLPIVILRGVKL